MTAATSTSTEASAPREIASTLRVWATATAGAALAITTIDAFLLQQKKSFFTGGFLSATHANGFVEGAGFVATSLIVDASIAGVLAAILLWLTSRVRLRPLARFTLVALGSLAPLVIWDFITYSLLGFLGDAFDLGLMFDLTGRSTSEVFAVASSHLATPVALIVVAAAGLLALVWTVDRFGPGAARARTIASRRVAFLGCAAFVVGLVACTAASSASELAEDGLRRKASGQVFTWLVSGLSDFDRDGSGIGGRTSDPAPFDAAIYPYALDVPGNGIDENGVGGDLPSAEPAYSEPAAAATWRHRPDVVLFVLESFRADAVGRIVNGIPVTPALDALAREGISSSRAFSHNGYTTQSRFHLLTGSLAGLLEGSIIDDFTAQGYQVAYFSGQDESFGGASMGVGFDRAEVAYDARRDRDRRYSTYTTAGSLAVSHKTLSGRVEEFLATRDSGRPLFLYVNFHDAHFPYHHREMEPILSNRHVAQSQIAPARRSEVQEMYYNAAANVDRALASTLAGVTRALGAPPVVIVTADHGESLFDEGFLGHGYALNDIQTRIPLIVRGLPMEIAEPFGQVDLRNAIAMALSRDVTGGAPRIVEGAGKRVFQYLGNIHRPRQIAFTGMEGTLVYDFRDRQVLFPDGTRARPDALSGGAADQFQRLIHFWERMMLARAAGGGARDE